MPCCPANPQCPCTNQNLRATRQRCQRICTALPACNAVRYFDGDNSCRFYTGAVTTSASTDQTCYTKCAPPLRVADEGADDHVPHHGTGDACVAEGLSSLSVQSSDGAVLRFVLSGGRRLDLPLGRVRVKVRWPGGD
eukprot:gene2690-55304_t